MNRSPSRQQGQAGYVLHTYPYRETSLVIEVFTREHGRIGMIAKGARRPKSSLRGVLAAFHPLILSWSGRAEMKTLHSAEWRGGYRRLAGRALICGFYLNELLLKLLHRDDPHDRLFDAYERALAALAGQAHDASTLRRFEKHLLSELGYALILDQDVTDRRPLDPSQRYTYVIDRGPVPAAHMQNGVELLGQTLIDMHADEYASTLTQQQSKTLMRTLISHYLGHQTLYSRQLLLDLQEL